MLETPNFSFRLGRVLGAWLCCIFWEDANRRHGESMIWIPSLERVWWMCFYHVSMYHIIPRIAMQVSKRWMNGELNRI
jgi:hypothetical protein